MRLLAETPGYLSSHKARGRLDIYDGAEGPEPPDSSSWEWATASLEAAACLRLLGADERETAIPRPTRGYV